MSELDSAKDLKLSENTRLLSLDGNDLTDINFNGVDIRNFTLHNCKNIDKAKNYPEDEEGKANLTRVSLKENDLRGVDLSKFKMQSAFIHNPLINSATEFPDDMSKTDLVSVNLSKRDLSKMNFTDALLYKVSFYESSLPESINNTKQLEQIQMNLADINNNLETLDNKTIINLLSKSRIELEDQENFNGKDVLEGYKPEKLIDLISVLNKARDQDPNISKPVLKVLNKVSNNSIQNLVKEIINKSKEANQDQKDLVDVLFILSDLKRNKSDSDFAKTLIQSINKKFINKEFSPFHQKLFKNFSSNHIT